MSERVFYLLWGFIVGVAWQSLWWWVSWWCGRRLAAKPEGTPE